MRTLDWSGWDWGASIERYSREIGVVLSGLLCLLGMMGGAVPATLSRRKRLEVLAVLRPLEAAMRRVIVMAAKGLAASPPAKRGGADALVPRGTGSSGRPLPFPLFDPRNPPIPKRRYVPKAREPRIWFFDGFDPPRPARMEPSEGDEISAVALTRRLLSLRAALSDIPKQAKRMARVVAKREAAGKKIVRPMRYARPPGHRYKGKRPVDLLLAETHELACIALREAMREAKPPP